MILVLYVELQQRGRVGKSIGDAPDELHPVETGQHQLRACLLRHLRDMERDRRVGDDPRDEDALAL